MLGSGASGGNFNGTPTFADAVSPTRFADYCLDPSSAGYDDATNAGQVGACGNSFAGGPPEE
jgi:hypothetical protein